MIKPVLRQRYVYILITLGSITFAFSMYVALKSPCPPWVDTTKGSVLILFVWFITYILLGYPRLVIANYARRHSPNGMFWFGVQVQCGSLMGSITSYLMVEKFALFHERKPCEHIAC
ncbi:unnamed protein product [Rotaria magnacalcarata]|nr:unnamed protein product [Rotaria magnacalcarata]